MCSVHKAFTGTTYHCQPKLVPGVMTAIPVDSVTIKGAKCPKFMKVTSKDKSIDTVAKKCNVSAKCLREANKSWLRSYANKQGVFRPSAIGKHLDIGCFTHSKYTRPS